MKIQADQEGAQAVQQIVDLALRGGGIQNLQAANVILSSISLMEEKEVEEVAEPTDK